MRNRRPGGSESQFNSQLPPAALTVAVMDAVAADVGASSAG